MKRLAAARHVEPFLPDPLGQGALQASPKFRHKYLLQTEALVIDVRLEA